MIDRIRALERRARPLDPGPSERAQLLQRVNEYADAFLQDLGESPAFVASEEKGEGLFDSPLSEDGIDVEEALALLGENVDTPGVNPASPRFLGYIPGGGLYYSALGDFLAAVANRYAGHFFPSPGAVRMENMLLEWMGDLVGYPETFGGNLTSGGSIAGLVAIVAARDAHDIEGADVNRAVVYLTEHTHHSLDKALRVAGLGSCIVRRVPVDDRFRMQSDALAQAVQSDRQAGLRPWLVVASAGSTNTGSVDPMKEVAGVADEHALWFHCDGAYGAFFALCEEGKKILKGMDRSHSLVMDPHKTLFLPYGTGAVLVRDRQTLFASHHYTADYMQDAARAVEAVSPADISPELTKHFRGLRLWLPLKVAGIAAFRAALKEKLLLARYFHAKIQEADGFEVGPPPDLSVVIYRYIPQRGDPDEFNARLIDSLQQDGRIFISSTVVDGNFMLRAAIVSFRTHLDDVDEALQVLKETAKTLENS